MDKVLSLKEIEKNIKVCEKCRLCKTAKNPVPGEGNPNSELVFIGEAPGETEDLTGRPFVGRAGRLLETMLTKIGYKREDVWIGNIIKHRPPQNRDPLPDEILACQPYLSEQLRIMSPKLIVTLGRFALSYFYNDGKISRDKGSLIATAKFNVFPVYHPAAALRSPQMAKALEEDFLKIPGVLLNLPVPKNVKEGKIFITSNRNLTKGNKESVDINLPDGQQGLF
ncbi:MAG: uracil-DNA glycosylase [Patescibacteria group bacterium]